MGWLNWAKARYETYPWRPEGCALILPEGTSMGEYRKIMEEYLRMHPYSRGVIGGKNPHGHGQIIHERGEIKTDIPFWAARWLIFDRDKKCQSCGAYVSQEYRQAKIMDYREWQKREREWWEKEKDSELAQLERLRKLMPTITDPKDKEIHEAVYESKLERINRCKDGEEFISEYEEKWLDDKIRFEETDTDPDSSFGLEVQHIIPVSEGGSNCTHNLVLLCHECHVKLKGGGGVAPMKEPSLSILQFATEE